MKSSIKIIRTATVASSLDWFLRGQLNFLNKYFNVIALSGQDFHLNQVAHREGVKTIPLKFERRISPVKDLISLIKLYIILKKEKPTIIHSVTPKAGLLSMIAGYFAGVPLRFHTFTGLYFPHKTGLIKLISIVMDKTLCRFSTAVFPEGQIVKKDLIAYNITKKPLHIIGNGNINGVNINYFKPNLFTLIEQVKIKKQSQVLNRDFVFIYIGRLVTDKGINELVEAFCSIDAIVDNVKLLLVGGFEQDIDPLNPNTITLIKENKNIQHLGFQNDVRPYMSISHILVLPSYREGFPNSVLEAGAMQLPAIVTNIGGCNEIIEDQYNGFLIEKKNMQTLKDTMLKSIKSKDKLVKMGENARTLVEKKFRNEILWDETLKIYNKYLSKLKS